MSLYKSKKYTEALPFLKKSNSYKDAETIILTIKTVLHDSKVTSFSTIHEIVEMGGYDWIILEKKGNRVLLISVQEIGKCAYHEDSLQNGISWANSSLRAKMASFYKSTFSQSEKTAIVETQTDGCKDYVFALSKNEVEKYFDTSKNAESTGKLPINGFWWTRTLGRKYNGHQSAYYTADFAGASKVTDTNNVGGRDQSAVFISARPAMWIDLSSDYFWE